MDFKVGKAVRTVARLFGSIVSACVVRVHFFMQRAILGPTCPDIVSLRHFFSKSFRQTDIRNHLVRKYPLLVRKSLVFDFY